MPSTTRRRFLGTIGLGAAACAVRPAWLAAAPAPAKKPNFVIVFTDDQGYGDLSWGKMGTGKNGDMLLFRLEFRGQDTEIGLTRGRRGIG